MKDPDGIKTIPWGLSVKNLLDLTPINSPRSPLEQDKIKLFSDACIRELKTFVARGNSFSAQPGETDDLVMSLVICCRMISYIASFEDDIFEVVNQNIGDGNRYDDDKPLDEYDEPMPIGLL